MDEREEQLEEAFTLLEERFEQLSAEDKNALCEEGLAQKDEANHIKLYYLCPITKGLIIEFGAIRVHNEALNQNLIEFYEKSPLEYYINNHHLSPLSRNPILSVGVITEGPFADAHKSYLVNLKYALDKFDRKNAIENNDSNRLALRL